MKKALDILIAPFRWLWTLFYSFLGGVFLMFLLGISLGLLGGIYRAGIKNPMIWVAVGVLVVLGFVARYFHVKTKAIQNQEKKQG